MGTHGLRFLRNFFANLRFLTSLISLMMTLPVEYFCRFQLVIGYMWFRGSDINLLLSNRSEMWSNAKIKKLQIFSVVFLNTTELF